MMRNVQAEEVYEKGLHALSNGHLYLALVCFEQAMNLQKNPLHCSHYAFCLAKARGHYREAMALCREALEKDPQNSVHHLNLGRIYSLAGKREKALHILRQGMQYDKNNEISRELEMMGTRRSPLIASLKREHLLNKYCGILLKKMGYR